MVVQQEDIRRGLRVIQNIHQRQILNCPSKIDFLTGRSSERENRLKGRVAGGREREGDVRSAREEDAEQREDNAEGVTQAKTTQGQLDVGTA